MWYNGIMATTNLTKAKKAKNDEFYTQYVDIEREMNAYLDYAPDVFRGKTVLCPCDDPEWSNFTKYFAQRFEYLGLKKLISTSFAADSNEYNTDYQPTLFETRSLQYDAAKTRSRGKIFVLEHGADAAKVDINNLQWRYLEGNGDFRSLEVKPLRDEADIIVTNPPFSLFREFVAWIMEAGKQFSIIGNQNAITYKEIFPLIRDNKIWLGRGFDAGNAYFRIPSGAAANKALCTVDAKGNRIVHFRNTRWFTNIEHGRRHEALDFLLVSEVFQYTRQKELLGNSAYDHYDNYDAVDVPYVDAIGRDYDGVMGVPVTFLDHYCPEQFEIIGLDRYVDDNPNYGHRFTINGKEIYARILIKKRKQ
jgi:hypothetical protein